MTEKMFLLPMNLQLFAGSEDESDDEIEFELEDDETDTDDESFEDDDEGDDGEDEDSEEYDDESDEEADEQQESDPGKGEGKNATAAAVIRERKKWQAKIKDLEQTAAVATRFMQQTGVTDIEEMNRRMDALESQRLQQSGVPADLADRMARTERQLKEQERDIRRQKHALEFEKLKIDPFYADIEDYRDELEEIAERTGSSLKAAYLAEHGERRIKEREAEIEAKVKANKQKRAAKKVDTSPTGAGGKASKRVNLSPEERAIAKAAGMSQEEYAKYKKR